MSKQKQNITINNHVNAGGESPNENDSSKGDKRLGRVAAWITIITGLIAIYYFYQDEITELFSSPETEYVEPVGLG